MRTTNFPKKGPSLAQREGGRGGGGMVRDMELKKGTNSEAAKFSHFAETESRFKKTLERTCRLLVCSILLKKHLCTLRSVRVV